MSETLSYQEPAATELNAEEQESLQVGEQMQHDQEQLLAGKYKSTDDLEKAYLELQSKLGSKDDEEPGEAQPEAVEETEQPESTEEPEQPEETDERPQLTQEDVDYLQDMVGGAEAYQSMVKWASSNLSKQEVQMYDSVMEIGDPAAVYFAVQALSSKYGDATGTDGKVLTGGKSSEQSTGFRSQQELIAAMSDPRYESDPAYRQDVISRLEQSDVEF